MLLRIAADWERATRHAHRLLAAGYDVQWCPGPIGAGFWVEDAARPALAGWGSDVETGTPPDNGWPLRPLRVAVYGTAGAPFHHLGLLGRLGFAAEPLTAGEIRSGALAACDAFIMPGGGVHGMAGQLEPLGEDGARRIGEFVRAGGLYLGSCAGAFLGACVSPAFRELYPYQPLMSLAEVRLFNDRDAWLGLESPGVGRVVVERASNGHPVLAGLPQRFEMTHYNGPLFMPEAPSLKGAGERVGLLRFVGRSERFTPSERFLATAAGDEDTARSCLFDDAVAAGAWGAVAARLDRGRVVLCGSHPEFGADPGLVETGVAARLVANALLWQAQQPEPAARAGASTGPSRRPTVAVAWEPPGARSGGADHAAAVTTANAAVTVAATLTACRRSLARVASMTEQLAQATISGNDGLPLPWLAPDRALSIFGQSAPHVWAAALEAIPKLAAAAERDLDAIGTLLQDDTQDPLDAAEALLQQQALAALVFRSLPEDGQDGGFEGVHALAEAALFRLGRARARLDFEPGVPSGMPYEDLDDNPYHLVASSYLGAIGLVAGLALAARQWRCRLEDQLAVRALRRTSMETELAN